MYCCTMHIVVQFVCMLIMALVLYVIYVGMSVCFFSANVILIKEIIMFRYGSKCILIFICF